MAYALDGSLGAVSSGGSGAAVTPAFDASPVANELLICWVFGAGTAGNQPATPSGWSAVPTTGALGAGFSNAIFYKIAAGGDSAPTIAGSAGMSWSAVMLGRFTGNATTSPLDKSKIANTSASSPLTTTCASADVAGKQLVIVCSGSNYALAGTKTLSNSINNGATTHDTTNNGTSSSTHYALGWGITTGNGSADSDSFSFTTTNFNNAQTLIASFLLLTGTPFNANAPAARSLAPTPTPTVAAGVGVSPGNSGNSQGHQKKPPSVSATVNLSAAHHITLGSAPKAPSVSAGVALTSSSARALGAGRSSGTPAVNETPTAAVVLARAAAPSISAGAALSSSSARALTAAQPSTVGVSEIPTATVALARCGAPTILATAALTAPAARSLTPSGTPGISAGVALTSSSARALAAGRSSTDAVAENPAPAVALARCGAPTILANSAILAAIAARAAARAATPSVTATAALTSNSARALIAARRPGAGIAQTAASARALSRAYSPTLSAAVTITPGPARAITSAHGIPSAAQNITGATVRALALARPGSVSVSIQVRAASGLGLARGSSTLQRADANLGSQAAIAWVYGHRPVLALILPVTRSGTARGSAGEPVLLAAIGVPLLIGLTDRLTTTPTVADMAFIVASAGDQRSDSAELGDQVASVAVLTTEPYEIGS